MADNITPSAVTISGSWSVTIPADRVMETPALASATTADLSQPVIAAIVDAASVVLDGLSITESVIEVMGGLNGGVVVTRTPDAVEPEA